MPQKRYVITITSGAKWRIGHLQPDGSYQQCHCIYDRHVDAWAATIIGHDCQPRQPQSRAFELPAPTHDQQDNDHTYAIQAGPNGPIKIGRSFDPKKRLNELQTGNPVRLALLGVLTITEAEAHDRFAAHRLRGEWFDITAAHISDCLHPFPTP